MLCEDGLGLGFEVIGFRKMLGKMKEVLWHVDGLEESGVLVFGLLGEGGHAF
jgi:hypothetical protein